jgi:hypothetical protein
MKLKIQTENLTKKMPKKKKTLLLSIMVQLIVPHDTKINEIGFFFGVFHRTFAHDTSVR